MSLHLLIQRVGGGSLIGRFVPFVAIAAANCINIPLMRQRELKYGVPVYDDQDNRLGMSKVSFELNTIDLRQMGRYIS